MSSRGETTLDAAVRVPRGQLVAQAWARLGPDVAPLSNASGRPLARTVKLILDPLVLRPVQNPRFAGATVRAEDAADLTSRITGAGPVLAATAAWFLLAKRARRQAGITEGNPQERYFQRCYELAHAHGHPDDVPDAATLAAGAVAEAHATDGRVTAAAVRAYVTDPAHAAALTRRRDAAWAARATITAPEGARHVDDVLASCATTPDTEAWTALVSGRYGARDAAHLEPPGAAREHGLTDRVSVGPPELGDAASKRRLPKPLDRSILERLFAEVATGHPIDGDVAELVRAEIGRSAQAWQLAEEPGRVVLALCRAAGPALTADDPVWPGGDARSRLRSRWRREAYVHRVLRLPAAGTTVVPDDLRAEIRDVRAVYLRRLWVRLHGRELRRQDVDAAAVWDLLDGVLRSVVLDQRDRLRAALARRATEEAR
ncbi:hypothetical protein [Jiangella rhizosphaerae]|uniref:Uncharacterized protein n=1 Tax=Jiangella rhizosphaerae TaxID=2293569 RepID=A0A418KK34_9ACTN|nr:hypothetical protein [Jiangella rhizosphaerae]RIQ15680.1 hypothetical protein DY240_24125 [Jiangella rhizosphaerae]